MRQLGGSEVPGLFHENNSSKILLAIGFYDPGDHEKPELVKKHPKFMVIKQNEGLTSIVYKSRIIF